MNNTGKSVSSRRPLHAFTLIELLVVVGIISLLVGILLPSLSKAKEIAREVTCMTRVNAQIKAVHMYAVEEDGSIPAGPDDPHAYFPGENWNTVAANWIWIGSRRTFNAHGVLLLRHLTQPEAFFCPDDDTADPIEELEHITEKSDTNAYCSYLYRQLDGRLEGITPSAKLDDLGLNKKHLPVRALVLDMNSLLPIPPIRTNHRGRRVAVAFADAHAGMFSTPNDEMTLRANDFNIMADRLDEILEYADSLGQ